MYNFFCILYLLLKKYIHTVETLSLLCESQEEEKTYLSERTKKVSEFSTL